MMRSGFQPEQLAIQHVRHCRRRMPVVGMNTSKRAENILPVHPLLDLRILTHVNWIVEIDEVMPQRLRKDDPSDCDQPSGNRESQDELGTHDPELCAEESAQTSCRS